MRNVVIAAVVLVLAVAVAQPVMAQSYMLGYTGSGSFMMSPVTYSGTFMFGGSGAWTWTFDDSLWPSPADSTARFDYIWETFFADNYDNTPGAEAWYGYFNGTTLPTAPRFSYDMTTPNGHVEGTMAVVILIRDWYADGILQQNEKHRNSNMSGTFSVEPAFGTGYFQDKCGHGSLSTGNFNFVNPPTLDSITATGQMQIYNCPSPVEDATWGAIKALYR